MDKRPTLSIGRKAKHKGQLQNPIADFKKAKSSHSYAAAQFEAPVVKKTQEIRRKAASFWEDEDGEDYVEHMLGRPTESIHSEEYMAQATTPELIMASRIKAAGPDVAAAFMSHAEKAKALTGVDPSGFSMSTKPSEKLSYMAKQGQIDLQKVASAMRHHDKQWGNPKAEGEYEDDFAQKLAEARKGGPVKNIQDPTQRMMSVVGAMTTSDQSWKQQVDAPDLITPDSHDKWVDPLQKAAQAIGMIAGAYIDPDKIEGGEFGESYAALHSRISKMLTRQIPARIANTGFEQATRGPGSKPVGWTQALPAVSDIAKTLPISDRMFLTSKVDKMWTEVDGRHESPFTDALKTIRDVYRTGNEGGLAKPKNLEHRERQYLLDEMTASGIVDPTQTVISQNPGRDEMYDFRVTNDASELLNDSLTALGVTQEDLIGDQNVRAQVKRTAAELAARGESPTALAASLVPKVDYTKLFEDTQGIKGTLKFSGKHMYGENKPPLIPLPDRGSPAPATPEPYPEKSKGKGGQATIAKKNPKAPDAINPRDVVQTAAEAKGEAAKASGDPEAAREKYFAERPWLKAIASDDDKSDPMSQWQRHRRGKVTSSAAGGLADPEGKKSAMHALVKGALTPFETPAEIGKGSIWTQSGDALEPVALDWYRKNIDPDAFEPGLIFNRNKAGQATTPDAIANGGSRNVEVKSRNKFIDPENPLDQNEAKTLRKNYMQMQHQMYLTGANTTDLVEILRDPENPNAPLGKNGLNDNNIRRRTVDRDDELIRKMRPQWEAAGKAADQISGLNNNTQKMFAKAVEEGNIQSFEKLSKRHGIEGYEALGATLGLGEGGGGDKDKKKKGGSGGGNYGGFGGRDAPTTARGAVRGGLSAMGAPGKMLNVALAGAEILWNTGIDLNDTGLELSKQARATGMREDLFRQTRLSMTQGRYLTEADAMSDMSSVALAKGGLEQGFTDRAVNLVESTRGAITLGDIHGTNLSDPDAIKNLMAQTETRLRNRGVSEYGIAATMEQSGLKSLLSAADAEGGRTDLNNAVTNISDTILAFKLEAGAALGTVAGFGTDYFAAMTESLSEIAGYLAPKDRDPSREPLANFGEPQIPKAWNAAKSRVQKDFNEVKGWLGFETEQPEMEVEMPTASALELSEEISQFAGMNGTLSVANQASLEKSFESLSQEQRNRAMAAVKGDALDTNQIARDVRGGGKLEVELTTTGIQLTVRDENGQLTSKAFKPYHGAEVE